MLATLLLDEIAPAADAELAVTVVVDAPPGHVYDCALRSDFAEMPKHDPLLRGLYTVRSLPDRIAAHLRCAEQQGAPASARLADLATEDAEWVRLAERPGEELVAGAIARLDGFETVWRRTDAGEYVGFSEPGWVKLLMSINVRPYGLERTLLTYETRAVATDDSARRTFARYWKVFRPGIHVVMARSLRAIKSAAENVHPPDDRFGHA